MSTLFRIVEPMGGRVVIDGHDLAQVPLHQLRTKLALVPQVTTAFSLQSWLVWVCEQCNQLTLWSSGTLVLFDEHVDYHGCGVHGHGSAGHVAYECKAAAGF